VNEVTTKVLDRTRNNGPGEPRPKTVVEVRELRKVFPKRPKGERHFWPFRCTRAATDPFMAVDGISFDIYEGEIFGLLGPNGAGKTTTIRMLSTLLEPTFGSARVNG